MTSDHSIHLINQFPDFSAPGFDLQRYNSLFVDHNVIINARSSDVTYDEHWGPLSVKCAFNGREYYRTGNRTLAVDDRSFLIFNEGKYYSSYIRSTAPVDSFTVNFNNTFVREAVAARTVRDELLLNDVERTVGGAVRFAEQLYLHSSAVSPLLHRLRTLSRSLRVHQSQITELFHDLFNALLMSQREVAAAIAGMPALKQSTKKELHRRLTAAKDFMDSCFDRPVTLTDIAGAAHLQRHYFLRQFKNTFRITPHQYLTRRRLDVARTLLRETSITDTCFSVGFDDPASFSRLFKKHFGLSPHEYRRQR